MREGITWSRIFHATDTCASLRMILQRGGAPRLMASSSSASVRGMASSSTYGLWIRWRMLRSSAGRSGCEHSWMLLRSTFWIA
jgi:hypothetical protein